MRARSHAVLSLQRRDPGFGTRAPPDQLDEVVGLFDRWASLAGLALAEHSGQTHADRVELGVDRRLAVAAIAVTAVGTMPIAVVARSTPGAVS